MRELISFCTAPPKVEENNSDSVRYQVCVKVLQDVLLAFPSEYFERYRTEPVWRGYRRNHKGGIPPQRTRKTCIVSLFTVY